MPIKNNMKLIRNDQESENKLIFDVDPDIIPLARLEAEFFLRRWREGSQDHWTANQERNNYIGLLGQKAFELTLQQRDVPYVPNDPVIDWRGVKDYDFRVPRVGRIEVKTVDYAANQANLIIKCAEWHNADYVIAVKLLDEQPTALRFMGYATGKSVLEEFNYSSSEYPCPNDPGYWRDLNFLKSARDFFDMLSKNTEELWKQ